MEIIFDQRDPNYDGWLQKNQDSVTSENNWRRLGDIVAYDLFHVSGLSAGLNRRQQARLDRKLELARNPESPLTRREIRHANRSYEPGMPLWSIPLVLPVVVAVKALEAAEKYAEKGFPGSSLILKQRDAMDHSLTMDEAIREAAGNILHSSLQPPIRAGHHALTLGTEPRDYVVNIDDLLDAAQDASRQDGSDETVERLRLLEVFADATPRLRSVQDRTAHAAGLFMSSTLLRNGELSTISLGQRADFMAEGPDTFRIHVTNPYQYLYDESPYVRQSGVGYMERRDDLAERTLDSNPIDTLLVQSRV